MKILGKLEVRQQITVNDLRPISIHTNTVTANAVTVDLDNGTHQIIDLANSTGLTAVTLTNFTVGMEFSLTIKQHATTPQNLTITPTVNEYGWDFSLVTAGESETIEIVYDGVNFECLTRQLVDNDNDTSDDRAFSASGAKLLKDEIDLKANSNDPRFHTRNRDTAFDLIDDITSLKALITLPANSAFVDGNIVMIVDGENRLTAYVLTVGNDAELLDQVIRPNDFALTTNERFWKKVIVNEHIDFLPDVDLIVADASVDPSPLVEGTRHVLESNTGALHTNYGAIIGVGNNDIVKYSTINSVAAWRVDYDVSVQGEGALAWNRDQDAFFRWTGTIWEKFGGLSQVTAGDALIKDNDTLHVQVNNGLSIRDDKLVLGTSDEDYGALRDDVNILGRNQNVNIGSPSAEINVDKGTLTIGLAYMDEDKTTVGADVNAVASIGGNLVVAGTFNYWGEDKTTGIAWLDATGQLVDYSNFHSNLKLFEGVTKTNLSQADVQDVFVGGVNLYGVGDFDTIGDGVSSPSIFKTNSSAIIDTTFATNIGTGANIRTNMKCISNGTVIIVTGDFTSFNGTNVNGIVALDTSGNIDATFQANFGTGFAGGSVSYMTLSTNFYFTGNFTSFNGQPNTEKIVRLLSANGSVDATFVPTAFAGFGAADRLGGLTNISGNLYVGGSVAPFLYKLDGTGTLDATFDANITTLALNGEVVETFNANGLVGIAGDFTDLATLGYNYVGLVTTGGTYPSFRDANFVLPNSISSNQSFPYGKTVTSPSLLQHIFIGVDTYNDVNVNKMMFLDENGVLGNGAVMVKGTVAKYNTDQSARFDLRSLPDVEYMKLKTMQAVSFAIHSTAPISDSVMFFGDAFFEEPILSGNITGYNIQVAQANSTFLTWNNLADVDALNTYANAANRPQWLLRVEAFFDGNTGNGNILFKHTNILL